MYTPEDHQDMQLAHDLLHWAAELINGVMERHRRDPELNLQTVSFLSGAVQEANLADRGVEMAERYMGWKQGGAA